MSPFVEGGITVDDSRQSPIDNGSSWFLLYEIFFKNLKTLSVLYDIHRLITKYQKSTLKIS